MTTGPIGLLDATGAAAALTDPTPGAGRHLGIGRSAPPWASPAAILFLAGGRQARVGRGTFEHLNLDDVSVGGEFARQEVDEGLYRSRGNAPLPRSDGS